MPTSKGLKPAAQKKLDRKMYDAVKAGDYANVAKNLKLGANPNAPAGKKGITAMHRVAALGNRKLELLLEDHGGTPVNKSEAALVPPDDVTEISQDDEHMFSVGEKVVLGPDYCDELDAMYGPLQVAEIGVVMGIDASKEASVQVKAPNGELFQYTPQALRVAGPAAPSPDGSATMRERASTGVLAMAKRMEMLNLEAQQQKRSRPVRESLSRLAIGHQKSRRGRHNRTGGAADDTADGSAGAPRKASTQATMLMDELSGAIGGRGGGGGLGGGPSKGGAAAPAVAPPPQEDAYEVPVAANSAPSASKLLNNKKSSSQSSTNVRRAGGCADMPRGGGRVDGLACMHESADHVAFVKACSRHLRAQWALTCVGRTR
eukprot:m.1213235 g.1213235  ORF g.1213235 m.1213235 type:complete len:375 (-) comp24602_c0_seq8:4356-5480(-)